jgi:hypothetical protein
VTKSLQQLLSEERVQQLLDLSLVGRAQRRLADFLGVVRGLQFLSAETSIAVNEVIAQSLARAKSAQERTAIDLIEASADEASFLETLTRRLAARSPLSDIEFEFSPAVEPTDANVGAERLDDILTSLTEGMAGAGVRNIRIATEVSPGEVRIRLSSSQPITSAAIGHRRINLYNRTLGWLGGRLECKKHDAGTEFVIKLSALHPIKSVTGKSFGGQRLEHPDLPRTGVHSRELP